MKYDFRNFVVIGAGGIGYYLAPLLAKLIAFSAENTNTANNQKPTLTIIDEDIVEDRNLARVYEEANLGMKKAAVLATICLDVVPAKVGLAVQVIDTYVTPDTFDRYHRSWYKDGVVVFCCVDNHKSRAFIEDKLSKLDTVVLVSGGNSYVEGQSQLYVRLNGKDITPPITHFCPDILDESDPRNMFPDEEDCTAEYEAEPQLILANATAGLTMLNMFYSECMVKDPSAATRNESIFDITDGGRVTAFTRSSLRKPIPQP